MSNSFSLGYSGGGFNQNYDFIAKGALLSLNQSISVAKNTNKPLRISCLYGSRDVNQNKPKPLDYYESRVKLVCNNPADEVEMVNEFITDLGALLFSVEQIKSFLAIAKTQNKYTIISDFKPWNKLKWKQMNSVVAQTKPDGVGIQLHLKHNFNHAIVFALLPGIILDLQDRGVDVHFSEVSVWANKKFNSYRAYETWDRIFDIADKFNIKSVTPWFNDVNIDGCYMPSFKGWENIPLNYKNL